MASTTTMSTESKHTRESPPELDSREKGSSTFYEEGDFMASEETIPIDKRIVPRLVRKFDLRLLILFVFVNLFSFIDRVNIGNARLLGMQEDVGLSGIKYNIAVMCAFIACALVEIPSNIVCKKIGAGVYVPFLVFSFGVITTLTALVENPGGLYVARFVLGIFEGGISPALVFVLSQL